MDDATQYWIFLTAMGDTVISRQETTAQRHFRTLTQAVLPDWSPIRPFPHRDVQRHLVGQVSIPPVHSSSVQAQSFQPSPKGSVSAPSQAVVVERIPVAAAIAPSETLTRSEPPLRQPSSAAPFSSFNLSPSSSTVSAPTPAELCLRCAISHQIDYACQQLADQFGPSHGFTRMVLVGAVLHDECLLAQGRSPRRQPQASSAYRSLATEIFETFDPERSSLRVWTVRLVRHNQTINEILLEHGIYFVSDWAILNDTNQAQLKRILGEFYSLSRVEVQVALLLLESYHTVYRGDRLHQHKTGRCLPPTPAQLQRIAQHLHTFQQEDGLTQLPYRSPQDTLQQLQALAHCLRDYRIHNRGGKPVTESIDDPTFNPSEVVMPTQTAPPDETDSSDDVMELYQQAFERSLDQAIQTVVEHRVAQLRKRKGNRDQLFLQGLELFHAQGLTMTEIATHLGYERQDKVSFLLKLKDLRADVRHALLQQLRQRVGAIAQQFLNPNQLQSLDQRLDLALTEQVDEMIGEAERETSGARNGPLQSRFARCLCHYLSHRSS